MALEKFQRLARRIVRSEMARAELTYPQLAARLGMESSEAENLRMRVGRGAFPASLFLEMLAALNVRELHVGELVEILERDMAASDGG